MQCYNRNRRLHYYDISQRGIKYVASVLNPFSWTVVYVDETRFLDAVPPDCKIVTIEENQEECTSRYFAYSRYNTEEANPIFPGEVMKELCQACHDANPIEGCWFQDAQLSRALIDGVPESFHHADERNQVVNGRRILLSKWDRSHLVSPGWESIQKNETEGPLPPKKPPQSPSKRPNWLQNNVKPWNPRETKSYASNTYYWCGEETGGKCNGRWRVHRPSECQGVARPGASPSPKKRRTNLKRGSQLRRGRKKLDG